jgi:rhomboid protease GluP
MPKNEQTIAINNIDKETVLAIAYQAMENLNWTIQFAGEDKILGSTAGGWNAKGQQVLVSMENNEFTVCSEMVNGESFDILGKNKKNTAAFITAFEAAKTSTDATAIENNKEAIIALRITTIKAAEEEQRQVEEVDKAMNLSGSNLYVTYAIIAINVLIFILMAINGAGIFEPDGLVHIKWGSNYSPLTLSGDWWRLITNVFIHFGIIHLAMNMYCLYMVGVYLEPMLGKAKYTTAYLCTGILASIVSLWWHKDPVNSAGASGAIFGMYGLFLALLTTNLIPKAIRQPQLQSIGIFVVYNLIYGMKGGVDNSAHIGGLISGFIIGYIFVISIKKEKQGTSLQWIVPVVAVLTLVIAFGYLENNKVAATERNAILNDVKAAGYKDSEMFNKKLNEFSLKEDNAITALKGADSITQPEFVKRLDIAIPDWEAAELLMKATEKYEISDASHKKATKLIEYTQLRKHQYNLLITLNKSTEEKDDILTNKQLEETNDKIIKLLEELKSL